MFAPCSSSGPRIGVLVEQRYLAQAQPAGLVAELRRRGTEVRVHIADHLPTELGDPAALEGIDLVVARGRSPRLLSLLRMAEAHGVAVVHDAASISAVVDKAGMAATLWRAGIPSPRTWLATVAELVATADLPFPLLLKPLFGDNARGIRVVADREGLSGLDWHEPVALAQPFHRGDGHDLKLYVAGSSVWAVRRPSPIERDGSPRTDPDAGREVPVTEEMSRLASACSGSFGLRLFGIDCIEVDRRLVVVEVNEFPNYRGLACDADAVLADVVMDSLPAAASLAGVPLIRAVAG